MKTSGAKEKKEKTGKEERSGQAGSTGGEVAPEKGAGSEKREAKRTRGTDKKTPREIISWVTAGGS